MNNEYSCATARVWRRLLGGLLTGALLLVVTASPLLHETRVVSAARQTAESLDVSALLLEVARNEKTMLRRRLEYTWTAKVTDRERNKRGEVTKESVNVYEVYPVLGEFARKLISRDGVPVSRERADKELKKTAERLEKAAQEEQKSGENKTPPPPTPKPTADAQNPAGIPSFGFTTGHKNSSGFSSSEISLAVWRFFRYDEFTAPRRERLRDRDVIVLDFRPRADFHPTDEVQRPYARLAGRLWIDAADKAVVRLEAWPDDTGAKSAGASATTTHESSVVFEHERLPDGVWLERLVRVESYGHKDIFNGIELDLTKEATGFQRFTTGAGEEKLDPPREKP
ncbi:MAG: hypothetical protein QOE46_3225 [Acidobacteriota bacterium]|nr:hypothetical protein [Acidobacteriota bacterium]